MAGGLATTATFTVGFGGPTGDLGPTADVLDDGGPRALTVTAVNVVLTPAGGGCAGGHLITDAALVSSLPVEIAPAPPPAPTALGAARARRAGA